jgi:mannan endo-1,4-beta-mannosidase
MFAKYLLHSILITATLAITFTSMNAQPIDRNATVETVQLWHNLGKIAQEHVLFGHQESLAYGYDWIGEQDRSDVRDITGSFPAVYGWDFGSLWDDSPAALKYNINKETLLKWTREGSSRGSIITFSWHAPNPISGGNFYDTTKVVSTILPGEENHATFVAMLDRLADFFHAAAPIPIIFRPYHEHNGDWFWWGKTHASEEEFIQLWRFTVDYLRDTKGVHNVLYAFSPDRSRMNRIRPVSEKNYFYAYPGDDYVDILGLDNYFDLGSHWNKAPVKKQMKDFVKSLELVVRLAEERNKIPTLSETGLDKLEYPDWWMDRLLAGINANEQTRKIAWVLVWRNANAANEGNDHFHTPHANHPGVDDFRAFKDSELILFEDELPQWFKELDSAGAAEQPGSRIPGSCTSHAGPNGEIP